jgi:hypothetical protein
MNCKPGDLAVIVRAVHPENVGCLVHVLGPSGENAAKNLTHHRGEVLWLVQAQRPLRTTFYLAGVPVDVKPTDTTNMPDSHLRPIRPQSDDATDESHAWLPPVPQTDKVSDRELVTVETP